MDEVFYVDWAPLVKNPQCASEIDIRINNKSLVRKHCDCASVPPQPEAILCYHNLIKSLTGFSRIFDLKAAN